MKSSIIVLDYSSGRVCIFPSPRDRAEFPDEMEVAVDAIITKHLMRPKDCHWMEFDGAIQINHEQLKTPKAKHLQGKIPVSNRRTRRASGRG